MTNLSADTATRREQAVRRPPAPGRRPATAWQHRAPLLRGILLYLIACLMLGGVAGLVWHATTSLPTYRINADGSAGMSERGLTSVFSSDATFCLIGLVTGLLLGLLAWWWFSRRPVAVVVLAAAGAALGALACWWVGVLIGPAGFAIRISGAKSGDEVPVDLALRTWVPLLVWLFAGLLPVLVISMVKWDGAERLRHGGSRRRRLHQDATAGSAGSPRTPSGTSDGAAADPSASSGPDH
jgi:hypothetical protein